MSIDVLWFVIVVMMFAVYAVLDGFNLGTGIIYLFVARTDDGATTGLEGHRSCVERQ